MLHVRLLHVGKTLTNLQILGYELHQNVFGPAQTRCRSYSAPPGLIAVIRGRGGTERGMKVLGVGREGKLGKEGRKVGWKLPSDVEKACMCLMALFFIRDDMP